MICSACSANLPDDANYCLRCGARQPRAEGVSPVRREICEIHRSGEEGSWFRAGDTYWEAIAVGPHGRYTVARSETCPRSGRGISRGIAIADTLLDQLIAKLAQEGWQPLPRGTEWYSYRFERYGAPLPVGGGTPEGTAPPASGEGGAA